MLKAGAELVLADHLEPVPDDARPYMSGASVAARQVAAAGAGRLLLTHLWPGSDHAAALAAARAEYPDEVGIATAGLTLDLG